MVADIGEVKRHIKPKADSTLRNMRKDELIEYIRCLENNYNVAVSFNENQAKYIESLGVLPMWIPVTERLPDDFSENLCRVIRPIPGGKYVRETKVLWCDYDKSWSCEGLIVTHWMPLPEPPKGE